MFKKALLGAVTATVFALPAAAQDLRRRRDGGAHRPAVEHLCAGGRRDASLYRPRQCGRRRQRPQDQARDRGRRRAALEGRGQHEKADHAGQRRPDGECEPVFDLCAGDRREQERGRAAAVRKRRLPAERLSAGRSAAVLHHRLRVAFRQPGDARLHQGDRQRAGEDRLLGDGDPALARRDGLRHGAVEERWAWIRWTRR